MSQELHEVAGAIHCHSVLSDGAGPVPHILQAAAQAGLDYLILTDHDTLAAREPGDASPGEGYQGGLLFLVGSEVSPPVNHYLALGASLSPPRSEPLQQVIDQVRAAGGLGFVAHPHDRGNRLLKVAAYPWQDQDVQGYTGLEVWNFFSQLLGAAQGVWGLLGAAFAPYRLVSRPQPETLALWDRLGQSRAVPAIGGIDAHGLMRCLLRLPLVATNYRLALKTVWTHALLDRPASGDWRRDGRALLEAVGRGRSYISSPGGAASRGFRLWAEGSGASLQMGDEGDRWAGPYRLRAVVPARSDVRLVRNGSTAAKREGVRDLDVTVKEPGVYRVEVYRRSLAGTRLWILSNAIYLRP
ncbi:MAG: CehA/McbA family metallohydrolase [Bacillota bacterium]